MRMRYMYHLLKENFDALEKFDITTETYKVSSVSSATRGRVSNWINAREAFISISTMPAFDDFCEFILNHEDFRHNLTAKEDTFVISYQAYQEISAKYSDFLEQVRGAIAFCESAGVCKGEHQGFDIKMPHADTLDEFTKDLSQLNKAISQCPYLNNDKERIILRKTDIGSIWFEFFVEGAAVLAGTSYILMNLSKIVDKCVKIRSHIAIAKQQEEQYRNAKIKNDAIEHVVEANKMLLTSVVSNCVNELKEEIKDEQLENPNEDEERIKYTLNTISSLMDKGMEIYASIESPKEIKDVFPTSDEMQSLPLPKKLLNPSKESE